MPPPVVPDHELLRLIGHGSYGEVWLAQNVMGAWRAVKVVRRDTFGSDRPFEREFSGIQRYEPISRSVEGVVPILHVGRSPEGFHYVMELADDASGTTAGNGALSVDTYAPRTLRSDLKRLGRLPVADCLELGLALAAGLAHLHRHGLVHRDLKPSNLIFVNGRARLADPGLVGAIDEARSFVGTLGYIPPEGPGSPGADVFALGRVLYEAATGFPPDEFPNPPPDWLTGEVPHGALELHEVILRACETDPARRYQSAAALQADLALLQSGQSVRRARKLERRVKTLRRAGVAAGLAMLAAAALVLFATYRAQVARANAARSDELRRRAEAAEHQARGRLAEAQLVRAGLERRSGLVGQRWHTLTLLGEAAAHTNLADLRGEAVAALALADIGELARRAFKGPPSPWFALDHTGARHTRAHPDGSVRLHATGDDRELATLEGASAGQLIAGPFSADGRRVAGRFREQATVWDTATGKRVFTRQTARLDTADLTPDGRQVALRDSAGRVTLFALEGDAVPPPFDQDLADGNCAFSPDGTRTIGFRRGTGEIRLLDWRTGATVETLALPARVGPLGIFWSPDSRGLLVSGDDFSGWFTRLDDPDRRWIRLVGHLAEITAAAFHPVRPLVLTASWDGTGRFWDWRDGQPLLRINRLLTEPRWSASGQLTWHEETSPGEHSLIIGNAALPEVARVLPEPPPASNLAANKGQWDAAFLADGKALAVAGQDGVRVWPTGTETAPLHLRLGRSRWLGVSHHGEVLWVSSQDGLRALRLKLGTADQTLSFQVVRHLPDLHGEWNLTALPDHLGVEIFQGVRRQRVTLNEAVEFPRLFDDVTRLSASADGRWLVVGDRVNDSLSLVRRDTVQPVRTLPVVVGGHTAFSPDSALLLISAATELRLESVAEGRVAWRHPRADTGGGPVAFAPDAHTVAAALTLDEPALIRARDGQLLARLPHPQNALISALKFSPDGRWLAVVTAAHHTLLWDLAGLRADLKPLGLDWDAPQLPASPTAEPPLRLVEAD